MRSYAFPLSLSLSVCVHWAKSTWGRSKRQPSLFQEEGFLQEPGLLAPWSRSPSLQHCETVKMEVCCWCRQAEQLELRQSDRRTNFLSLDFELSRTIWEHFNVFCDTASQSTNQPTNDTEATCTLFYKSDSYIKVTQRYCCMLCVKVVCQENLSGGE